MNLVKDNIILRAIEKKDNIVLKALINDPETEKNVGGWSFPSSDERQEKWYNDITYDSTNKHVRYAVEVNGVCIGMAALHEIDYKNATAGIDIKLIKEARGQGVGTCVIKMLVKNAFDELNLHCLEALILEDNGISRKVFEKAGFILEGTLRNRIYKNGKYKNQCSYSILKEEYANERNR